MLLNNVDYKNIFFSRSDGIAVNLKADLKNALDLNENFLVLSIENIDTPKETDLFYWIGKDRWTLNEFKYFALNNNLCCKIFDKAGIELASYGVCGDNTRIFNEIFGINFN